MDFFSKAKRLAKFIDKDKRFLYLASKGIYDGLSDEEYLKRKYHAVFHKDLDLDNPVTYNEKLQWLKLHDRKPIYISMVDKFEVKKYVAELIGEKYIIPTLGLWDTFDKIDFSSLPSQFVLKCTHDSGSVIICKNKENFDYKTIKKKINTSLRRNFYYVGREWPYKNIKPRIIAEEYIEDSKHKELKDYKFFCFNGVVKAMFIASDRQKEGEETKFDFFDANFNHLNIKQGHPNSTVLPDKPEKLDEMKRMAETLSKNMPHVRVDFYEVNGKVYFGEYTFYHFSGMVPFEPEEWDYKLGEWIKLPDKN